MGGCAHFDFDKKAAQYLFGFPCSQVQRGFPNNSLQVFAENYSQKTSHVDNKSTKLNAKLTLRNKCGFALAFFVPFFVYLGLALKY